MKNKQELFNALPETFTYSMAEEICVKLGFKSRFFKSVLRGKQFSCQFKRIEHGTYKKIDKNIEQDPIIEQLRSIELTIKLLNVKFENLKASINK